MNTKETKERLRESVRDFGSGPREAGRNLWLAGLGAASSVDTKSRELFDRLVERGRERSKRDLFTVPRALHTAGDRVKDFTRKIERRVEGNTAAILKRFGVPERREVHELIERIEQLTRKVEDFATARS